MEITVFRTVSRKITDKSWYIIESDRAVALSDLSTVVLNRLTNHVGIIWIECRFGKRHIETVT